MEKRNIVYMNADSFNSLMGKPVDESNSLLYIIEKNDKQLDQTRQYLLNDSNIWAVITRNSSTIEFSKRHDVAVAQITVENFKKIPEMQKTEVRTIGDANTVLVAELLQRNGIKRNSSDIKL